MPELLPLGAWHQVGGEAPGPECHPHIDFPALPRTLWLKYLAKYEPGQRPWQAVNGHAARYKIRRVLSTLNVPSARQYGTHDFRRGHAQAFACMPRGSAPYVFACVQDMLSDGCNLAQIQRAGQWRSGAFMQYLDKIGLERAVALEVTIQSDNEEMSDSD